MRRRTVIITVAVLAVVIIGVFAVSRMQTKADTVPVISDSVETAQSDIVEEPEQETEQAPPVTDEEPKQTEEAAPVEPEQDDTEAEETDVAEEEQDTEPIDEALTDITALDKTMYAISPVNTRSGPSTEYERVGGLTTNQEVHVVGVSNITSWFQIDVDGVIQFVSNKYLADTKVEVQQAQQQTTPQSSDYDFDHVQQDNDALDALLGISPGHPHLDDIPVGTVDPNVPLTVEDRGITAE